MYLILFSLTLLRQCTGVQQLREQILRTCNYWLGQIKRLYFSWLMYRCSTRAILAQHNHNNHGVITFSKTYSSLSCPVKCSLRPVAFSTWLNFCCQKKSASWVWSKQVEWCPTFNWHQSDWNRPDGTYGDSWYLFQPTFAETYWFF